MENTENKHRKTEPTTIKVWDGGVRLFHWALVILFCLSSYSAFQSKFGIYGDMHTYSGIAILVLLIWRILWGFTGSETARFTSFIHGPRRIIAYMKARSSGPHIGHNPLGGWSVMFVLLLLVAQVILGLYASDGMLFSGPFAYRTDYASEITNIHEITGYVLMGWAGLHVVAVLYYRLVLKVNLLWPMITGRAKIVSGMVTPLMASPIKAFVCLAVAAGGVYWWIYL